MIAALLLSALLQAPQPALVISVSGTVEMEHGSTRRMLARFDRVPEGAKIITHADSAASLRLASGSLVRMGPKTTISLDRLEVRSPAARRNESISVSIGRVWSRVMRLFGNDSSFEVATTNAVAGVRGTAFWVEVTRPDAPARFVVDEGAIWLRQGEHVLELRGAGATALSGQEGLQPQPTTPRAQLSKWRRQLATPLGAAIFELGSGLPVVGRGAHEAFRQRLIGPSGLGDTVTDATSGSKLHVDAPAELRIELKAP